MLIGYARVSTHEQNLTSQADALRKAGCQRILADRVSGARSERSGLKAALEYVREENTLLVWRLDRLGRLLEDLVETSGVWRNEELDSGAFKSPSIPPPAEDGLYSTSSER